MSTAANASPLRRVSPDQERLFIIGQPISLDNGPMLL
jgi:hypothetical protein